MIFILFMTNKINNSNCNYLMTGKTTCGNIFDLISLSMNKAFSTFHNKK